MALNELLQLHLDDIYNKCLHCGLCLPTCPTYNINLNEESSPRGRIQLMRSVQDSSINISDRFVDEIYFCLDCQACETACPAGVRFGELLEATRCSIADLNRDPIIIKMIKKIFLNGILSSPSRLKIFSMFMHLYQKSGLQEAVDVSNILSIFSESVQERHRLLPKTNERPFNETVPEVLSVDGKSRGRVAFLSGCIMNIAFADTHRDCIKVLLLNGFDVVIPKGQVCCGSLHAHNGEIEKAQELARKNIDVFESYRFDVLVVDSAGCSAFMKEYKNLFQEDKVYNEKAKAFSQKVKEITAFLNEAGLTIKPKPLNKKVTYHDACHLVHTQKISSQPRELIQAIPEIEFVELPESTWCCGSAGVYNIHRYEDSMKILDRKIENIGSTNAEIVLTANPGCHLQLMYGIRKAGLKMEIMHPISLLSEAYQ